MKTCLLTEDKSRVLLTGEITVERRKDNLGREHITFLFVPDEGNPSFFRTVLGISRFALEVRRGTYIVRFSGGDALSRDPIKFKPVSS